MERNVVEECVLFFQRNRAYDRLFEALRRQYQSYGRLAGTVRLDGLSAAEQDGLRALLGRNMDGARVKLSMSELQNALDETRFAGVSVTELVQAYFPDGLLTNRQKKERAQAREERFWDVLMADAAASCGSDARCMAWLAEMRREKKYGYLLVMREEKAEREKICSEKSFKNRQCAPRPACQENGKYETGSGKENRDGTGKIRQTVLAVCQAVSRLETAAGQGGSGIRLAVLGAEVTKNPHFFDRQNLAGRLLIAALGFLTGGGEPKQQEEVLELYYRSGIKPDDISSFTTCYGIHFYTEAGEHEAYRHFIRNREKYVVTLSNLERLTGAGCRDGRVFIVENQMVFSQLCEELQEEPYGLLCTSGQLKTASLLVIDLLLEAGCRLYYSGDTDPEGIEIADRVTARNPERILPWRMTEADYYASLSRETLSESRLKKLEKIRHAALQPLCAALWREKRAGYQEHLIRQMVADIRAGDDAPFSTITGQTGNSNKTQK